MREKSAFWLARRESFPLEIGRANNALRAKHREGSLAADVPFGRIFRILCGIIYTTKNYQYYWDNDWSCVRGLQEQMQPLLVSTKEIAVRYSAHPKTVLKWVRAKVLPVVRINKRCIRFNVEVCDKVMNHRTSISKNMSHE